MSKKVNNHRDTRLLDKSTFDDPSEFVEAGSDLEFDMISEWDRGDLVETVQELDQKCFKLEAKLEIAKRQLELCGAACGVAATFLEFHGRPGPQLKNCVENMLKHEYMAEDALKKIEGEKK